MKKRNVILDFTSLLDVTLIVIFFFVMFSYLDIEENRVKAENTIAEMETAIKKAEEREAIAEAYLAQLEKEIEIVRNSSERQAADIKEMLEYGKSGNVKVLLIMQEDGWMVRVNCKESVVAEIDSDANVGEELFQAIQEAGYEAEDTVFCDFVFDGLLPGTALAYRKITKGFRFVSEKYKYLYYSETDLSIGEE